MEEMTIFVIVVTIIIIWVVRKYDKERLEKEKEKNEQIRRNIERFEDAIFSGINLKGWSKSLKNHYYNRIKEHDFFEGLSIKMYDYYKSVDGTSFVIFYDREDLLWRSESIISRKKAGSINFRLAEGKTLEECIRYSESKMNKVDFTHQKDLLRERDTIIEDMERVLDVYKEENPDNYELEYYQYLMKKMVEIDQLITRNHESVKSLNRRNYIKNFKEYLGL